MDHHTKLNELSHQKHDAEAFLLDKEALDHELYAIKTEAANHGNHFAMVENFIEKYIPVRIQSQISFTLQEVLPEKALGLLSEYEKARFKEMHTILLDDDGIPQLAEQLKEIRFDMNNLGRYQGPKQLRRGTGAQ